MSNIVLDNIQEYALERLMASDRFCLFWDVGVGKTYPVLKRLSFFENKRILILAPAVVVKGMWAKEEKYDRFDVFYNNDVEIRSFEWLAHARYEKVGSSRRRVESNDRNLNHSRYDVIIIDEAHRIASGTRQSRTSSIINRLQKLATHVYSLTGTPARNGYQDLYYLFQNMGIKPWGEHWDYNLWVRYYFKGYEMKLPHTIVFKPTELKPQLKHDFMESIDPWCIFAKKTRTWDYEEIMVNVPNAKRTKEYFEALKGIVTDAMGNKVTTNTLVGFGRAYMLLNGFEYVLQPDGNNATVSHFINPKFAYLERGIKNELYGKNNERVVIVVYNYKHDYHYLVENLTKKGYKVVDNEDDARNTEEKVVYLLQLKKGIGINLQDIANVIMFYTYNFSFVDHDQTIGRVDRRGQKKNVRIYFFVLENTIEDTVVLKAIFTKRRIDHTLKSRKAATDIRKEIARYEH